MPTSKRAESSTLPAYEFSRPSTLRRYDLVRFEHTNGSVVFGRVIRTTVLPKLGCVIGRVNEDLVRTMELSVAIYDDEGIVTQRNGDALFEV